MIAAAALLSLASFAPASAAVSVPAAPQVADDVVQVQSGERRRSERGHDGHRHDYRPGRRYDRAPSHWHRHSHRPRDWRRRGCIIVGPLWFCP